MKIERIILMSIMTLVVGVGTWLLRESATALTIIAPVFITSIGSYLGLDLLKMVKATEVLPTGEYKMMDKWKYYFCLGLFILLIGETIFIEFYYKLKITIPMSMFISGAVIVLGVMLNGLKANSIATDKE